MGPHRERVLGRFLHTTLQPLAKQVEAELSEKLDGDVKLDLSATFASDLSGRSRAFASMVTWWNVARKGRWLGWTHGGRLRAIYP